MEQTNGFSIPLSNILRLLWRGLPVALVAAVVVSGLSYFLSRTLTKQYEARASVLVAQNTPDLRSFGVTLTAAPTLDVSAYRKAVLSGPVIQSVMTSLGLAQQDAKSIDHFRDAITIHTEAAQDSSLIDIITSDSQPEQAMLKANLLAQGLVNWDKARASESLGQVVTALEQQIIALDEQIRTLQAQGSANDIILGRINQRAEQQDQLTYAKALSNSAVGLLTIVEPALVPVDPVAPRPMLNAAIAFLLTAVLSYGLLHLRDTLKPAGIEDLAQATSLPILASFAKLAAGQKQLPNETTNYLRTNLLFAAGNTQPKVILVASANENEGKTSVALSLAESFVRNGTYTLLVDADLRSPSIAKEYKMLSSRLGHTSLETWLRNPEVTRDVVRMPVVTGQDLFVIPSFQASTYAAELLGNSFPTCLNNWRQEYEVIIIDSAPLLQVADTLSIAPFCTDTLLVVNQERSNPRSLRTAVEMLKRIGAHVSGMVATHIHKVADPVGYGELDSLAKQTSFNVSVKKPVNERSS